MLQANSTTRLGESYTAIPRLKSSRDIAELPSDPYIQSSLDKVELPSEASLQSSRDNVELPSEPCLQSSRDMANYLQKSSSTSCQEYPLNTWFVPSVYQNNFINTLMILTFT